MGTSSVDHILHVHLPKGMFLVSKAGEPWLCHFCSEFSFIRVDFHNGYIWNLNVELYKFFKEVILGLGIVNMHILNSE